MLIRTAVNNLRGSLQIRVTGEHVERFLNLATRNGIWLWDVQFARGDLFAKVALADFRSLRPVARRTRSRVHIIRRLGAPFQLKRLRQRMAWVLAGILSLALIVFLSQFVWFIRVRGCEAIPPEQVAAVAARAGISIGAWRRGISVPDVRQAILAELDQLSWVAINMRGTLVTLEVVEKATRPDMVQPSGPCDMVAARDAVVSDIVVLAGEPRVKKGDTVHAGDVLIAGILGDDLVTDYPHVVPMLVQARGLVTGRVWRTAEAEVQLRSVTTERTGRTCQRMVIKGGGWEIVVWGWRVPFADYEVDPRPDSQGRSSFLPVELIRTTYHEVRRVETQLTVAEARQEAERLATHLALRDVPAGAVVVDSAAFVQLADETHVVVRVVVETHEDITGPLVPRQ